MVSFRALFTSALALSAPVLSQITPQMAVDNIRSLTDKSQALQGPATSITIINGPLIVIGLGPFPTLIAGFTDIVITAGTAITQMKTMAPVPAGKDADAIFDAFREFIRVHQALLQILIGKAGLFNAVPFIGAPVAAVLRLIEGVVDTIAFSLVDKIQSRASELSTSTKSLSVTINIAVNSYEGLKLGKRDVPARPLRFARHEIAAAA